MDEPTASLDPEVRNDVLDLIHDLQREKDVAVLYTSHDMAEVSRICDRVMFLSHGRIVAEDTPANLTRLVGDATLLLTFEGAGKTVLDYCRDKNIQGRLVKKSLVEVHLPEERIPKVLFGLSKRGVRILHLGIRKPDLEDVFLSIAKNGGKSP